MKQAIIDFASGLGIAEIVLIALGVYVFVKLFPYIFWLAGNLLLMLVTLLAGAVCAIAIIVYDVLCDVLCYFKNKIKSH